MIERNTLIAVAGFMAFSAVSVVLLGASGLTAEHIDTLFFQFLSAALEGGSAFNIYYIIAGIFFLSLSFAFVAAYSLFREKIDFLFSAISLILIAVCGAVIGFSSTGIAFGAGLSLSSVVIQYLVIDDKKAYKELRPGRICAQACETALLLASAIIAVSVFFAVSSNESYVAESSDLLVDYVVNSTISGKSATIIALGDRNVSVELAPGDIDTIKTKVKSLDFFGIFEENYAILSAVLAFSVFQIIFSMAVSKLAGIFSWVLWKLSEPQTA